MDNKLFNVNGSGSEMLLKALELSFMQEGSRTTCSGWQQTEENGLILCWSNKPEGIHPFPADLSAKQCLGFVEEWLSSDFASKVKLGGWCEDSDHDGHNTEGWQVYCEEWGHVGNQRYSICAIRPAFMWHGK